jgi:hypothetical protein
VSRFLDNRKALIALAVAIAFVAVAVPTCRMIGCSMEMGYMGFMHPDSAFGFFQDCGGAYTVNSAPSAIVPAGSQSILTLLSGALAAIAVVAFAPFVISRPSLIVDATAPPPPEEPRGERFRV